MNTCNKLTAYAESDADSALLDGIAEELNIDIVYGMDGTNGNIYLTIDRNGLALTDGTLRVSGDFMRLLPRLRTSNLRSELLVRAAKPERYSKTPTVFDATAGLGEDALLLAASGFFVIMCEYDPVIAVLLADALRRASDIPELHDTVARMVLRPGDSTEILPALGSAPDIVYLDPMFPGRQKSGLVKKKFQLLHRLESPCANENALLQAAIAANPGKIIVKRPAKGAFLAGLKPGYSLGAGGIRYDCIVFPEYTTEK